MQECFRFHTETEFGGDRAGASEDYDYVPHFPRQNEQAFSGWGGWGGEWIARARQHCPPKTAISKNCSAWLCGMRRCLRVARRQARRCQTKPVQALNRHCYAMRNQDDPTLPPSWIDSFGSASRETRFNLVGLKTTRQEVLRRAFDYLQRPRARGRCDCQAGISSLSPWPRIASR